MKTITQILVISVFTSFWISCTRDKCIETVTYTTYKPVYLDYETFRNSVASLPPREMKNPGKIWIQGNWLYVNEQEEGVHIIDNSNPANPVFISFLRIPGNGDIAVRNGILYADSYIDLIAVDITDPHNAVVTERIEDIFPQTLGNGYYGYHPDSGIVIDWVETTETVTVETDCQGNSYYPSWGWLEGDIAFNSTGMGGGNPAGTITDAPSKGGSMARFTLVSHYLYAIDHSDMHLFDISQAAKPVIWNKVNVGFDIETIFPYNDLLFIGAQNGMHIYRIDNPASPVYISTYAHIRSCDPVVVNDRYAFVTLRSGTPCQGFTNQLDVVDISDPAQPQLVKSYSMYNPHGLGLAEKTLFICDGDAGLKIFDVTDIQSIDQHLIKHYGGIHAYDVIPYNNQLLIMVGEDGIMQYDYNDLTNIQLLSSLPVSP